MIAVDTSSLVAYLQDQKGEDVDAIDFALAQGIVVLPPAVLTEILSDRSLPKQVVHFLKGIPLLPIKKDYWQRAGELRSKIIAKRFKARITDSLVAQVCIDNSVALITRDKDFRYFVEHKLELFDQ